MALPFKGKKGPGDSDMLVTEALLHSSNKPGGPRGSFFTSPKPEPPLGAHGQSYCSCPKPQSCKKKDLGELCPHPHCPEVVPARVGPRLTSAIRETKSEVKNYNVQYPKPKLGLCKEL